MADFVKSKFKKIKESSQSKSPEFMEIKAPAQEILEFYGNTKQEQKMNEAIAANAQALFAERYGEQIPDKDTVETKVLDTIGGIFKEKEVGFFEEG